jgi:hypothetical protein
LNPARASSLQLRNQKFEVREAANKCLYFWLPGIEDTRQQSQICIQRSDIIAQVTIDRKKIEAIMNGIEFKKQGRYYYHPNTPYFVEFISGPPTLVKNQLV